MKLANVLFAVAGASVASASWIDDLIEHGITDFEVLLKLLEIPHCAIVCLPAAAETVKCNPLDLHCQCKAQSQLALAALPCLQNSCSSSKIQQAATVLGEICQLINPATTATSGTTEPTSTTSAGWVKMEATTTSRYWRFARTTNAADAPTAVMAAAVVTTGSAIPSVVSSIPQSPSTVATAAADPHAVPVGIMVGAAAAAFAALL